MASFGLYLLDACPPASAADPLSGRWTLNRARSHYGPGAQPRKQETFDCEMTDTGLRCMIRGERADGQVLIGRFHASYDGKAYPVTGIPDVDQVILRKVDDCVADATFSHKGEPVLGYRVVKGDDGRSLTMISVEPVSRKVLSSVVVYDRQ